MKLKILPVLMLIIVACTDTSENTPSVPVVDDGFDPVEADATLISQGMINGVGHSVTGTASLYDDDGTKVLVFDPFTSQNGPDLRVYLSKDAGASDYINLGLLKSINGKQSYEIAGNINLAEYPYALVWCQKYSVIFAKAELK